MPNGCSRAERAFSSTSRQRSHRLRGRLVSQPAERAVSSTTRPPVRRIRTLGLEIGFHAEHRDPADNDACLTRIQRAADWRAELGPEAEVGGFIGRPDQWRRVSEIWVDPDLSDDGIAWEIAARLTDYIVAIEPHR